MSDDAPEQSSKTEDPSAKKLEDARKKGDVVKSQEVNTWFMLLGSTMVFAMMLPSMSSGLMTSLKGLIENADRYDISGAAFGTFFQGLAGSIMMLVLPPLAFLMVFAVIGNLVQHRPLISAESMTPKLSKISPLAGAKRLFSRDALINFLIGVFKITIVGVAVFMAVWPERDRLDTMMTTDPLVIMVEVQELGLKVLIATLIVVTVIALVDFVYQRQKWWKRQMMTVQETRDEYKQMEGDPKIKGRLRQLRFERGRRRMMAAVPEASVIITNPTHYAVALKYERSMAAPICVAKGMDAVALRIRALADEHGVPIVENVALARALYASVEIDETVPNEHFKAVAEVIGFVLRLKSRPGWRAN